MAFFRSGCRIKSSLILGALRFPKLPGLHCFDVSHLADVPAAPDGASHGPIARPRRPEKAKVIQFQDYPRTTSTPPKMRLCNHLTISVLQWRKNRGVEVVEKIFAYFHGAVCNVLNIMALQSVVWK